MSITLPLESHLHRRTKTSVEIQYYPNKIVKDYAKWWGSGVSMVKNEKVPAIGSGTQILAIPA